MPDLPHHDPPHPLPHPTPIPAQACHKHVEERLASSREHFTAALGGTSTGPLGAQVETLLLKCLQAPALPKQTKTAYKNQQSQPNRNRLPDRVWRGLAHQASTIHPQQPPSQPHLSPKYPENLISLRELPCCPRSPWTRPPTHTQGVTFFIPAGKTDGDHPRRRHHSPGALVRRHTANLNVGTALCLFLLSPCSHSTIHQSIIHPSNPHSC